MKSNLNTFFTPLGVVLFGLWATGCYTVKTYDTPDKARFSDIMAVMTDGRHYHFSGNRWSVSQEGNIVGTGVECSSNSVEYHREMEVIAAFTDTLQSAHIASISSRHLEAGRTVLLVLGIVGLMFVIDSASGRGKKSGWGFGPSF